MKTPIATLLVLVVICTCQSMAADQPKVTITAQDTPIKDVIAQVSQQTGASIVLDPKATGSVTISLSNADLSQTLNTVTKLNNLSWKKLQFAKPSEDTVKLDQLRSAMLALAKLPMVALAVDDPASKTSSVYAKDIPSCPDTAGIKLPEGYEWTTAYVVLAPEQSAKPEQPKDTDSDSDEQSTLDKVTEATKQNVLDLAKMTSEDRQQVYQSQIQAEMDLDPEVRQQMMQDRMQAMRNLPQEVRDQMRQQGGMFGGPGGRRGRSED